MIEDADAANAYLHFVHALCEMACNQKRISVQEREVENEKYAFRCFLLRLGFIGEEYKVEAEDWAYVTAKCKEALGYIAEARTNK